MKTAETALPEVLVLEPVLHRDARGAFLELYNQARYAEAGVPWTFVQDNLVESNRGVLRGLHFQNPNAQGKLVSVLRGAVFSVAVDIRRSSPRFGEWVGLHVSAENRLQYWVPPGFAHGYLALSDEVLMLYKCTERYHPECERYLKWDDPAVGVRWPITDPPLLSPKDEAALPLSMLTEQLFA